MGVPAKFEWFESYVGHCLGEWNDGIVPPVDDDGDWAVDWGGGVVWVRAVDVPIWAADVFAYAAQGVAPRVKALREVNELNSRLSTATAYITPAGTVMIRQRIIAAGVSRHTIAQAVFSVGSVAEDVGVLMAGLFDGYAPFAAANEGA